MSEITRRALLAGTGAAVAAAALPIPLPEIAHVLALPTPLVPLGLGIRVSYLGTHQTTEYALGVWSHKTFEPMEPWHV